MKKAFRIISVLLFCVILLSQLPATPASAWAKATYNDVKNSTTEEMKGQINALTALIEENRKSLADAEKMKATAAEKREIYLTLEALYDDALGAMEDELLLIGKKTEELDNEILLSEQNYQKKYEEFLDLLKMIYEEGTPNYIEIIVGASSFSDMLSRIERLRSVVGYTDTLMKNLKNKKKELSEAREKQLALAAEKNENIALYEAKTQELAEWQAENEAEILAINAEIDRMIAENDEYNEKSDVLDAEFQILVQELIEEEDGRRKEDERQRQIAAQKAEESRKAAEEAARIAALKAAEDGKKYLWPLPMTENVITYPWGMRMHPVYNKMMMHNGIDIAAPRGTPVFAAKSGKVTTCTYHATAGYYIVIDHLDGTYTMYEHGLANSFKVKKGDTVKQGQQIMSVGSTGTSTGYHLHFEIHYGSNSVDPLDSKNVPLITPTTLNKRY